MKNFIAQYNYDQEVTYIEEENDENPTVCDGNENGDGLVELHRDDDDNEDDDDDDEDNEDDDEDENEDDDEDEDDDDYKGNDKSDENGSIMVNSSDGREGDSDSNEECEVAPKKKNLKRIRISSSDED